MSQGNTMNNIKINKDGHLICPTCNGSYLHHCDVADMDNVNDCVGSESNVTLIGSGKVTKSYSNVNLPFRGDSIAIKFWCESCCEEEKYKYLYISQHKGNTFFTWENQFPEHPKVFEI